MRRFLGVLGLAVLAAACSSSKKTKRVDIADDDVIMGTGLESADVESLERFAQDLLALPELTGPNVEGVPTISIEGVENNTRFDFDTDLLVRRIRQQLVEHGRGKIIVVGSSKRDEALTEKERLEKREGYRTSSKQVTRPGRDYFLTGTASAISKVGEKRESDAIWIDFRLVDAETQAIVWEKAYKTKKVGKEAGVVYR